VFRDDHPLAWTYHRNTCRWPFNMHGLNVPRSSMAAFKEHPGAPLIPLPPPDALTTPLGDVMVMRQSCRRFLPEAISLASLGTVLRLTYGVLGEAESFDGFLERPVPSGGALYPLELYVLVQRVQEARVGVLHYLPLVHAVEVLHDEPLPRLLTSELFLGQPYLADAAGILVISAVVERSMWKYEDRGYRYILLEAGHVAQNAILSAYGLGLAALPLGGFFDDDLGALLRLDGDHEIALYGVALGVPAPVDRNQRRLPANGDERFRRY
jgi:SagB-type dehydrogenase family enzyme